jgi:hypothetical protein
VRSLFFFKGWMTDPRREAPSGILFFDKEEIVRDDADDPRNPNQRMAKCERCGAFMEPAATACTWCGVGGDNGSASSFVVPPPANLAVAEGAPAALSGTAAGPEVFLPATPSIASPTEKQNLQGIGGWLILLAAELALSPVGTVGLLATDAALVLSGHLAGPLPSRGILTGLLFLDAIADVAILAGLIVVNVLFYGKKKNFPRWMIGFLVGRFILAAAVHQVMLSYIAFNNSLLAFDSLVSAVVWIPYLLLSQRVKQTFVH